MEYSKNLSLPLSLLTLPACQALLPCQRKPSSCLPLSSPAVPPIISCLLCLLALSLQDRALRRGGGFKPSHCLMLKKKKGSSSRGRTGALCVLLRHNQLCSDRKIYTSVKKEEGEWGQGQEEGGGKYSLFTYIKKRRAWQAGRGKNKKKIQKYKNTKIKRKISPSLEKEKGDIRREEKKRSSSRHLSFIGMAWGVAWPVGMKNLLPACTRETSHL